MEYKEAKVFWNANDRQNNEVISKIKQHIQ